MEVIMRSWLKIIAIVFLASSLFLGSISCNTMHGMGEDIEAAGEEIEEEASD